MSEEVDNIDDPWAQLDDETDAEWRLRMHNGFPESGFQLGGISLWEVEEAVINGDAEAQSKNYTNAELLAMTKDPDHPLEVPQWMIDEWEEASGTPT
jgi:hypothetical protein